MSALTCPTCDSPLAANVRFCSNCGQVIAQATTEVLSPTSSQTPNAPIITAPQPPQAPLLDSYAAQPLAAQPSNPTQPTQNQPVYAPQPAYPQAQQPYTQPQNINVVVHTTAQAVSQGGVTNVILVKQKSVFVALLLTFLFGPFGLFYVTVSGAIIFLLVSVVLTVITGGAFGILAWVISMIWGGVAASNYNKRIIGH